MSTALVTSIEAVRERLKWPGAGPDDPPGARPQGRAYGSVGFVPTMGALHEGHARLIDQARRECDRVVVSIFVNPLQFDREEDLRGYPRSLDADLALCSRVGVEIAFAPDAASIYPGPPTCTVDVGNMADHLCGRFRPGHFRGVATIVLKLFQMVQPDRAYFGEKDAQQLAIVRRLVADFNVPVTIVGVPTVRDADGLALSSRNQRLDSLERALAPALHRALGEAARLIASGSRDSQRIKAEAGDAIPPHPALRLEYLEIVDPDTMQPIDAISSWPVLVAGALWVGSTRLIDNVLASPPSHPAAAKV